MNNSVSWKPSASITNLLKRAFIIKKIRKFFTDRKFLEVETPALSQATVTNIHLFPFQTNFIQEGEKKEIPLYLMTSPEYHMKRLLVAGSGPIFQLCRSFRNKEIGCYHNPEFTMLEWYRPYYGMFSLMNEVNNLLQHILNCKRAKIFSYQQLFIEYLKIDPLSANKEQLYNTVVKYNLKEVVSLEETADTLLQLLFTMVIEPNIGRDIPVFVYHFPSSQAELATISTKDYRVANRFEVYFKGIELANGFHELTNVHEHRQRFKQDNLNRIAMKLTEQPIDENLLAALEKGMPECSGVALGIDRLVMLAIKAKCLSDVIAFSLEKA